MSEIDRLSEQHILESEAHLRHIDELMSRTQQAGATTGLASDLQSRLDELRGLRDTAAQALEALRQQPGAQDATQVKGTLQTIGAEMEKVLTAVLGTVRR